MALAKVLSCAVIELDGELIDVEVDIAQMRDEGMI